MTEFLSTHEPATGALITELPIGDAAREVAIARDRKSTRLNSSH